MVSSIVLPATFAAQLDRTYAYQLYPLSPRCTLPLPFGHIWWQRGKNRWATTLNKLLHRESYLAMRVEGWKGDVAVLYVRDGVALALTWARADTPRTCSS